MILSKSGSSRCSGHLRMPTDPVHSITSYINNLHPQHHSQLYSVIEKVIAKVIPLWSLTLSPMRRQFVAIRPRIVQDAVEYIHINKDQQPLKAKDETRIDWYERRDTWKRQNRILIMPEPGEFMTREERVPEHRRHELLDHETGLLKALDLRREYKDDGLQVIVKLANIQLTPEKPQYEGGAWHLEGQSVGTLWEARTSFQWGLLLI